MVLPSRVHIEPLPGPPHRQVQGSADGQDADGDWQVGAAAAITC